MPIVDRYRPRFAAWLALLAFLIAQLATAAYACPLVGNALQGTMAEDRMSAPCEEGMAIDRASSALCLEHCKVGQQLVDTPLPVIPVAAVSVWFFLVPSPVTDTSARRVSIEPLLARATSPPVLASTARLRI